MLTDIMSRATTGTENNSGKGSNGGIWEWTSTPFETHEGLSPTNLFVGSVTNLPYPETLGKLIDQLFSRYSTDFFDKKHQIAVRFFYCTSSQNLADIDMNSWEHHMPPFLDLQAGGRSETSISITTHTPGLVDEWYMIYEVIYIL